MYGLDRNLETETKTKGVKDETRAAGLPLPPNFYGDLKWIRWATA